MYKNIAKIIVGLLSKLVVVVVLTTYYLPLTTYGSFEDNSGGARMRGLGGAFVSIADDSEGIFIQPAGTLNMKQPQLCATYGRLFMGLSDGSEITDSAFVFTYPVDDRSGIGLGYKSTGLRQAYTEQCMLFNISMGVYKTVSLGLNVKYLALKYGTDAYTRLDPVFSSGYDRIAADADAGILARPLDSLSVGYSVRNLMQSDLGLQSKEPASLQEHLGINYHEPSYLMALETERTNGKYKYTGALEKGFFAKLFKLRFGFGWGDNHYRKIAAGFGFDLKQFIVDYAWEYPLSGIEQTIGTHYITFTARLGNFAGDKQVRKKAGTEAKPTLPDAASTSAGNATAPVPDQVTTSEAVKPAVSQTLKEGTMPLSPVMMPGMLMPLKPPVAAFAGPVSTNTRISNDTPVSTHTLVRPNTAVSDGILKSSASTSVPVAVGPVVSTEPVKTGGLVIISTKPATIFRSETTAAKPGIPSSPVSDGSKIDDIVPAIIPGIGIIIKHEPAKPAVKPESVKIENKSRYTQPSSFPSGTRTYKVTSKDTMMTLAEKYYGNRSQWVIIYQANKDKIEKGALKPGQMIIIP